MYYRQTAGLLSGCLLLFPRKLMWTDSTVIRFFNSLSLLFISFFTCRVDPAYRQAHGR